MGIIQYGLLLFFYPGLFNFRVLIYILIAFTSYLIFGKKLYLNTNEKKFHYAITAMISIYGLLLILK